MSTKIYLEISINLLEKIHLHGEQAYPEEGAGFLLGSIDEEKRFVKELLFIENAREDDARRNRYLITPKDFLLAENKASSLCLDIIGVFHSHPDHPSQPSEFDREWAMPWFSYVITSVNLGEAILSRSWRLSEDRKLFSEEKIEIIR